MTSITPQDIDRAAGTGPGHYLDDAITTVLRWWPRLAGHRQAIDYCYLTLRDGVANTAAACSPRRLPTAIPAVRQAADALRAQQFERARGLLLTARASL